MTQSNDIPWQISKKTDDELLDLLAHEIDYTPQAIELAKAEATRRNLDLRSLVIPEEPNNDNLTPATVLLPGEEYPDDLWIKKFCLGAFLVTPIWMIAHGKVFLGLLIMLFYATTNAVLLLAIWSENILLIFLGLVYWLSPFGVSTYFGFKGNRIAWNDRGHHEMPWVKRREEKWTMVGVIITGAALILVYAQIFLCSRAISY